MTHDVTASRVLDVVLQSPSVPHKEKRKFVMTFIGHYHTLVDDRIGSRIGDNCWAFADPYLRVCGCLFPLCRPLLIVCVRGQEKIARSMIPHERTLAASFFGKFFARNLNLYLLQRNPEQWKTVQMNFKTASSSHVELSNKNLPPPSVELEVGTTETFIQQESQASGADGMKYKKRKVRAEDEIDRLFEKLGKKVKKAGLAADTAADTTVQDGINQLRKKHRKLTLAETDKGLEDVLGAIKVAPKVNSGHGHKKK